MLTTPQQNPQKTYLIFWNVQGDPETLEDLMRVKADARICLGDLICKTNSEDDEIRKTVYSIALAEYYGCQLLPGENEKRCSAQKSFPHYMTKEKLRNLPTKKDSGELVFLSCLPVPTTSNEDKILIDKIGRAHV